MNTQTAEQLAPDFRNAFRLPTQASRCQDQNAEHMRAAIARERAAPIIIDQPKPKPKPEREATKMGRRPIAGTAQRQMVLDALAGMDRGTSTDIARVIGLTTEAVGKMLWFLHRDGLIRQAGSRKKNKIWEAIQ